MDQLDNDQRRLYFTKLEKKQKDPDTYAVLIWCLGSFGVHKFYLGQVGHGLAHVALGFFGWVFLVAGLATGLPMMAILGGLFLMGDFAIWAKDLICQSADLEKHNQGIEQEIIQEIQKHAA